MHQGLPEQLPREKSLWRLLPLVPGALGRQRKGERVGPRGAGAQGRGLGAQQSSNSAYSRAAWSPEAQWLEEPQRCLVWKP